MNYEKSFIDISFLKEKMKIFCNQLNIKKWDYGASSSNDYSVQVESGEAKQLKSSQRQILTIRVWSKANLVGITSTSDLSDQGIQKALVIADKASQYGNKSISPEFSPLSKSKLSYENSSLISPPQGISKLLIELKKAEKNLINSHKAIKSVPYNGLSESIFQKIYANSLGAYRDIQKNYSAVYLYARAEENMRKPRSSGSVITSNSFENLDIKKCIEEASSKTISHLNYKPIKTGKYKICFSPEAFITLINAFSSLFNARSILDGLSLSNKNSIGTRIAAPILNISDDPLNKNNVGYSTFDGEGTPTKKLSLIEKGKLVNLLHSESTAKIFNTHPTGHATLGVKAIVSPQWFVIQRDSEFKIKTNPLNHREYEGEYVLIEDLNAIHAGVKASQGSFSLPFDGWLVDNKKRTSIEAATVAGDIRDVLNNIIDIEEEEFITINGISPHVWIDNLSITGEA